VQASERRARILAALAERGRVDVEQLALEFETSEITVRRDLERLAEEGALRRVRGGAVSSNLRGEGIPFSARLEQGDRTLKQRLATAVATLISDGEAVIVDSGTTGTATAHALASRRVTVLPMSVQGIAALAGSTTVSLLTPAGSVRPSEGSIVGPLIDQTLRELRFDTAVLTCCGADPRTGVSAYDITDAAAKKAIVGAARRTILFAESSKFARSAMATVCTFDAVDIVVTDAGLPDEVRAALTEADVTVVIA
jgi:DeoR/GlpR family transcriptional regulator of sugar metabolism